MNVKLYNIVQKYNFMTLKTGSSLMEKIFSGSRSDMTRWLLAST